MSHVGRESLPIAGLGAPAVLCAVAAAMLALALAVSAGNYGRRSLALTTAAAVTGLVAAALARRRTGPGVVDRRVEQATALILGATVAASLLAHVIHSPAPEHVPPRPASFVVLGVIALVVLATYLPRAERGLIRFGLPVPSLRLPIWMLCAVGMGVAVLRSVPVPFIDVWTFQQEAVATLLRGGDPYAHAFTNVFGNLAFFSPAIADSRFVHAFPYQPLTILLGIPAYLLAGDTRYTMLLAILVGAWSIARLAPGRAGTLGAAAVLFHPRTYHVLDRAWTEPTVLATAGLALLALGATRRRAGRNWIALGTAGALFVASKQYTPLFVLPLLPLVPVKARWRAGALAIALLLVVFVPFAAWNFHAFWRGVLEMQALQPFRDDSLSWSAALVQSFGRAPPPAWIGFVAAAIAMAVAWPRGGTVAGAVLCGTVSFLFFLLLGKQAFLNYYWLANALLVLVSALLCREPRGVAAGAAT